MILRLIVKIPTFNIFFEDRSNLAVFSESVCASITVYRDSYFDTIRGFWENSSVYVVWNFLTLTSIHNTHVHKHTHTKTPILHTFYRIYIHFTYILQKQRSLHRHFICAYVHSDLPRPESALSVLNCSLLSTVCLLCSLSDKTHL